MIVKEYEVMEKNLAQELEAFFALPKQSQYHSPVWKVLSANMKGLKSIVPQVVELLGDPEVSLAKHLTQHHETQPVELSVDSQHQKAQELKSLLTMPANSASTSSVYNERWCLLFEELGGSDVVDYIKEQISRRKDCAVNEHMFRWLERNKKKIQDEVLDPPDDYRFMNGYTI